MSQQIKFRGGGLVGKVRSSWPFVTLTATKDQLIFNSPLIARYVFEPKDVISIAPLTGFMQKGLRIKHNVSQYKENVEFWPLKNPEDILNEIRMIGFPFKTNP